ncbi:MAG TPA: hypothetical protein PLE72_09045 [Azospira sp.]|nr:hypothetical protein [Azospira sp.]HNN44978.1 hypothetical protein [Azospira sp.]
MDMQRVVPNRNSSSHYSDDGKKPFNDWHITDLYREKLAQAERFRNEAKTKPAPALRCSFRERAKTLEIDASDLAHCIAKFGDQMIFSMNLEMLKAEVYGAICNGSNPWVQGLDMIEDIIRERSMLDNQ